MFNPPPKNPFVVGDFVDAGGCSGTVEEIGMFYTKLATLDNKLVQLPNSTIVSANITNFSRGASSLERLKALSRTFISIFTTTRQSAAVMRALNTLLVVIWEMVC